MITIKDLGADCWEIRVEDYRACVDSRNVDPWECLAWATEMYLRFGNVVPMQRFTFVFDIDLAPIMGDSGGKQPRTFVVRVKALSKEAAHRYIIGEFGYHAFHAVFHGWPNVIRGEVITSRADLEQRYSPAAIAAKQQKAYNAALGGECLPVD